MKAYFLTQQLIHLSPFIIILHNILMLVFMCTNLQLLNNYNLFYGNKISYEANDDIIAVNILNPELY
jgi:hypothetical protein